MTEFILRRWKFEDAEQLTEISNNENIARWLRDWFPHPYILEDAERYLSIAEMRGDRRCLMRAIVADEKVIGSISVDLQDDVCKKSAELGYWLDENFWGRGITTEAVKRICKVAFMKFDIVRIFAITFEKNIASRRVLEKVGFTYESTIRDGISKNGEIQSYCMYSILRREVNF